MHPILVVPRKQSPFVLNVKGRVGFFYIMKRGEWQGFLMKKQRIVVKIGSSSLTNDQGEIDQEKFNDHIECACRTPSSGA